MKDLAFGRPFALKRLSEQSIPIPSESGTTIQPGEHYLEDGDGKLYRLDEISIADFYGDFQVSETGDLALVDGKKADEQQVFCRTRTSRPDWPYHPWIGADLEELRGLQNTQATAAKGVRQIIAALTRDGRFDGKPVEVIPIPIGPESILFYIFIGEGEAAVPLRVELG